MYRGGRLAIGQVVLSPAQDGAEEILTSLSSTKTAGTICMIQELSLLFAFTILHVPANLLSTM